MAAEVSDSASKANGGLIGPFSHDDMSPQLQELVDKMKPGDITQPIRTPKRLPDLQARDARRRRRCSRSTAVRDLIADKVAGARTQTEMRKFLARAARAGDHRVEERRAEEGLRKADRRRAGGASAAQ